MTRVNRQSAVLAAILALGAGPAMSENDDSYAPPPEPRYFQCGGRQVVAEACQAFTCLADLWQDFKNEAKAQADRAKPKAVALLGKAISDQASADTLLRERYNAVQRAIDELSAQAQEAYDQMEAPGLSDAQRAQLQAKANANSFAAQRLQQTTLRNMGFRIEELAQANQAAISASNSLSLDTSYEYDADAVWANRLTFHQKAQNAIDRERQAFRGVKDYTDNWLENTRGFVVSGPDQFGVGARLEALRRELVGLGDRLQGLIGTDWCRRPGVECPSPLSSELDQAWQAWFTSNGNARRELPWLRSVDRVDTARQNYADALEHANALVGDGDDDKNFITATLHLFSTHRYAWMALHGRQAEGGGRRRNDYGQLVNQSCR